VVSTGDHSRRIKLVLEYDGTCFSGFQIQGKGERTVQGTLEAALARIAGHDVTVVGAGRTDSGVHARGQVAHADLMGRIPTERIAGALNGILPSDLSVRAASEAEPGFHARFSARQRTYIYLIWNAPYRSAVWGRFTTWEETPLDIGAMQAAAGLLVGARDFAAFANAGGDPGSTMVRDVRRFDVRMLGAGPIVAIRVTANAFLRSMVRNLAGMLISVGRLELTVAEAAGIAAMGNREQNPSATAPAQGLCLVRVDY
jgi:tRNA pseudouridine38-40 synthase